MTELADKIRAIIETEGPMPFDRYMELCLACPGLGYYLTRDPFGADGDFTTSPEISQMFGELVGLWIAETWTRQEAREPVRLVELGPGRGTLMSDALRACRVAPGLPDEHQGNLPRRDEPDPAREAGREAARTRHSGALVRLLRRHS